MNNKMLTVKVDRYYMLWMLCWILKIQSIYFVNDNENVFLKRYRKSIAVGYLRFITFYVSGRRTRL